MHRENRRLFAKLHNIDNDNSQKRSYTQREATVLQKQQKLADHRAKLSKKRAIVVARKCAKLRKKASAKK